MTTVGSSARSFVCSIATLGLVARRESPYETSSAAAVRRDSPSNVDCKQESRPNAASRAKKRGKQTSPDGTRRRRSDRLNRIEKQVSAHEVTA